MWIFEGENVCSQTKSNPFESWLKAGSKFNRNVSLQKNGCIIDSSLNSSLSSIHQALILDVKPLISIIFGEYILKFWVGDKHSQITNIKTIKEGPVKRFPPLWTEDLCPPELLCWGPNPQYGGVLKWSFWEMIGIQWGNGGRVPHGTGVLIRGKRNQTSPVLWEISSCFLRHQSVIFCYNNPYWLKHLSHLDPNLVG